MASVYDASLSRPSRSAWSGVASLILGRLSASLLVLIGVAFIVFWGIDQAPADPVTAALGPFATPEQRATFVQQHGLDDPMPLRFVRFIAGALQGDLGQSTTRPVNASTLVGKAVPVTVQLTTLAILIATVLGVSAGVLAAKRANKGTDRSVRLSAAVLVAAPDFWVGIIAIQLFAVNLGWMPSGGYQPLANGFLPWLEHIIMPATVLALPLSATLANQVRSSMIQELDRDYVRSAMGQGLSSTRVLTSVFKNAATGPLTLLGVRASYMLSGAIIIEQIFNLPGLGTLLVEGVRQGDLAVTRAVALVGTMGILIISFVLDLAYLAINPRARK
ncbi:ABC transporter permease [Qaidamihabitans albus]|uniref:ABC transporter permease n=1 Tax=Qaidamihabitans albus TaxID=2795733 RepID=UPI0022A8A0E0|nr:ABC transporter permease [Qaidamihabitans albus]